MSKVYEMRTREENGRLEVRSCEGRWFDVADYRRSLEQYPSHAIKFVGDEGPCLTNVVSINPECGCRVVGCGTLQFPITIEFCDAHSAPAGPAGPAAPAIHPVEDEEEPEKVPTLERNDWDTFSLFYEDIEVIVDRANGDGDIEIRVWRNGKNEDYPFAKVNFDVTEGEKEDFIVAADAVRAQVMAGELPAGSWLCGCGDIHGADDRICPKGFKGAN